MAIERIIFSGSGGQGLLFIGKLLAGMLLDRFPYLTFFPSYGAEVRGGTSHCQVIYSSEEIASPVAEEADSLVLMNQPSVDRFLSHLAPNGIVIINSSLADAPREDNIIALPATDIAVESGDIRTANVVMFGAYLRQRALFSFDEASESIRAASSAKAPRFTSINIDALTRGWQYMEDTPLSG